MRFISSILGVMLLLLVLGGCATPPVEDTSAKAAVDSVSAFRTALHVIENCQKADWIRDYRAVEGALVGYVGPTHALANMTEADKAALDVALALVARDSAHAFTIVMCDSQAHFVNAYRTDSTRSRSHSSEDDALMGLSKGLAQFRLLMEAAIKDNLLKSVDYFTDPAVVMINTRMLDITDVGVQEQIKLVLSGAATLGRYSAGSADGDVVLVDAHTKRLVGLYHDDTVIRYDLKGAPRKPARTRPHTPSASDPAATGGSAEGTAPS